MEQVVAVGEGSLWRKVYKTELN